MIFIIFMFFNIVVMSVVVVIIDKVFLDVVLISGIFVMSKMLGVLMVIGGIGCGGSIYVIGLNFMLLDIMLIINMGVLEIVIFVVSGIDVVVLIFDGLLMVLGGIVVGKKLYI